MSWRWGSEDQEDEARRRSFTRARLLVVLEELLGEPDPMAAADELLTDLLMHCWPSAASQKQ